VDRLPEIRTAPPGPASVALARRLAEVECPAITGQEPAPVFWERALGSNVYDVDGNCYVDLQAGFGVMALGYAHPTLARVMAEQAAELPHAMGDVFPARLKVELLEALERALPGDLGCAILSSSGSDAVESALKTALVATGKPGVVAFEGAYHGLGLGSLDVTHRPHFRAPFAGRLAGRTSFVAFGDVEAARRAARECDAGAILVEPVQGRGGVRPAPIGFLRGLRDLADELGILLIFDEVYSGFGRTGRMLACEHDGVLPDVVTLGKALGAGLPISACAGRPAVMQRWGKSSGEAIHTSTHLGSPLGCAVGIRVLELIQSEGLIERAGTLGERALARLQAGLAGVPGVRDVRGRGLMLGVELDDPERAFGICEAALERGWILLGEGRDGEVISMTPALNVPESLLDAGVDCLVELLSS